MLLKSISLGSGSTFILRSITTENGVVMKKEIHPKYDKVVVRCGCGNTFETRSTVKEIHAEICSMCHPFYTGKQKYVDTAGRIERFQKKYGTSYIKAAPLSPPPRLASENAGAGPLRAQGTLNKGAGKKPENGKPKKTKKDQQQ